MQGGMHAGLFTPVIKTATTNFFPFALTCFPMYVKIINPKTNGRKVYNNSGSSQRCVNYLVAEAKKTGTEATFFGPSGSEPKTAAGAVALLDGNVKGLGEKVPKFHSLVLSPSTDELLLIGNNPKALEQYTHNVMGLYAENFNLKKGERLREESLVWTATIHQERTNRGTDEGVQGEKKDGLQTHVHIMVSARDADQKITINPLGTVSRFNRVRFHAEAVVQMEMQFGRVRVLDVAVAEPIRRELVEQKMEEIKSKAAANQKERKPLTPEQVAAKDTRIDVQVARINTKLYESMHLDPARVKEIAKERQYDRVFFSTLGRTESNAVKGTYTPEPYEYLATGRVSRLPHFDMDGGLEVESAPSPFHFEYEKAPEITGGGDAALRRSIDKLEEAIAARNRAHDAPRVAEKVREIVPVRGQELELD